ncbi:small nuclear ribonucleoprotein U2, A [Viridothelium virens]|uniref:U2 small nuclear ribonucleoprotein A' n=1 Tax=Viridothelium virens TaxID=1048519 RepID=A0A6A6HL49_VIRVR|nr:small nuclear ribonucleoprotein U2, A [Viridothelium virens]
MRLNADLIHNSLSYLNPLKERELDLRGHKLPAIENLGVAKDHDAFDFTDNDISQLSNFPLSPRVHTLLCARNRITTIQPSLPQSIPNLSTLVLTANQISELADLDPLAGFPRLTALVLMENPVSRKENYRYWVIWRCPSVRLLDFQRVREGEREKATELFGTASEPSALASKILSVKSRTFDIHDSGQANGTMQSKSNRVDLNEAEKKRVREAIRNAKSLQEMRRLEKELNEGRVPS